MVWRGAAARALVVASLFAGCGSRLARGAGAEFLPVTRPWPVETCARHQARLDALSCRADADAGLAESRAALSARRSLGRVAQVAPLAQQRAADERTPRGRAPWSFLALRATLAESRFADAAALFDEPTPTTAAWSLAAVTAVHAAAHEAAEPQRAAAIQAARAVSARARASAALDADLRRGGLDRLDALLTCAAGDRGGAIAALGAIEHPAEVARAAAADRARLVRGGPCVGPLEVDVAAHAAFERGRRAIEDGAQGALNACLEWRVGLAALVFEVGRDGLARDVRVLESTFEAPEVERCLVNLIGAQRFPDGPRPIVGALVARSCG